MSSTDRIDDATVRVRSEFRHWLRVVSAQQEIPIYVLLEQLAAEARRGKKPWNDKRWKKSR